MDVLYLVHRTKYDWRRFEPHPEWIQPQWTTDDYIQAYAAGIPGSVRVAFFPVWNNPKVTGLEAGVSYRAAFFNPVNGREYPIGPVSADAAGAWKPTAFATRNVRVVAISVDTQEESARLARSQGYEFPILSDPGARVIREYGVLHEHGGEEGKDIARPAEFLVDHSGTIRWANLSRTVLARLRPEIALDVIDQTIAR